MKFFERLSTDKKIILAIIAIALCARLLSFGYLSFLAASNPSAHPYPIVAGDSADYALLADNLLTLHAYDDTPGVPARVWPPGYPILLAVAKVVTGSVGFIVIVQVLLSSLAIALIYLMARTLVPRPYAVIPALIYAIEPMVVFSDTAVLTDGLFSALLVCIVYLAFFQSRLRGMVRWGLVGLLLGIAILIRPIAEFLVFVFPAAYLMREWMRGASAGEGRIKSICAFFVACAIILVPWMVRNEVIFDSFEVTNLAGSNLLSFSVRPFLVWRMLAQTTDPMPAILVPRHMTDPIFAVEDKQIAADLTSITPPGANPDNYKGRLVIQYIMRDPIRYAYFDLVNTTPFFLSSSITSYEQIVSQERNNTDFYAPVMLSLVDAWNHLRHPESLGMFTSALWSLVPLVLEVVLWALISLSALIALVLKRRDSTVLFFAVLVAYFAILTGIQSLSRYRIPAEPYLLILAVVGVHEIVTRVKAKWMRKDLV